MIFILLTFLAALLLSGIAEYYSILGLFAIFPGGGFLSAVLLGGSLGFGKLISASWLYRNWKTAPKLLKGYLSTAIIVLMLITSLGIFGFLAQSHIESTVNLGQSNIEITTLDQQETIIKDRLKYLLARAGDPATASRKIDNQIQDTQKELVEIQQKKLPFMKEQNKLAADVGPVKYVADMFYTNDQNGIDKAVRLVIFAIMLAFDPLAVLLLIAGNKSLMERKNGKMLPLSDSKENDTFTKDEVIPLPQKKETSNIKRNRKETVEIARDNIYSLYDLEEK